MMEDVSHSHLDPEDAHIRRPRGPGQRSSYKQVLI